jgi:hypothetical protein
VSGYKAVWPKNVHRRYWRAKPKRNINKFRKNE